MRVAILSDIHDNIRTLRAALAALAGAEELICCGDLCSPFIVDELGRGFGGGIHVVFGNNDGDRYRIAQKAGEYEHIRIYPELAELLLGGRRFAVVYFDNIGEAIAGSGKYDVVCYGHNHRYEVSREGATLKINPGEVFGGLSGVSTYVTYDTDTGEATRHEVPA